MESRRTLRFAKAGPDPTGIRARAGAGFFSPALLTEGVGGKGEVRNKPTRKHRISNFAACATPPPNPLPPNPLPPNPLPQGEGEYFIILHAASGIAIVGRRLRVATAVSYACAALNSSGSANGLAISWVHTGNPPAPKPLHTLMAG
jgi:hypothetical protein